MRTLPLLLGASVVGVLAYAVLRPAPALPPAPPSRQPLPDVPILGPGGGVVLSPGGAALPTTTTAPPMTAPALPRVPARKPTEATAAANLVSQAVRTLLDPRTIVPPDLLLSYAATLEAARQDRAIVAALRQKAGS